MDAVTDLIWGAPKSLWMVIAAMKLKHLILGRTAMTKLVCMHALASVGSDYEPMDRSLPGASFHGILQGRIL